MRWIGRLLAAALVAAVLAPVPASAAATVTIRGRGWGHGIGMSQYGAYGRAQNGASAKQILEHYYKGANVSAVTIPSKIRVGLHQGQHRVGVGSTAGPSGGGKLLFKVAGASEPLASGPAGTNWRVEPSTTGGMRLYKNGTQVRKDGKGVFGDPTRPLVSVYQRFGSLASISNKPYKYAYGKIEFATYGTTCNGSYCLRVVLSLSMQRYLYGLGEVPASWPDAALRAQAIAGRTYAYDKMLRFAERRYPCDCHVYDSTVDQAYIGDAKRTGSGIYWDDWKGAVDDTKGQVARYQGSPIQALYSSSSGGHTEHNENVWGGTPIPYLRGVPDAPDATSANPNYRWSVQMSLRTFKNKLENFYNGNSSTRFGNYNDIDLLKPFGISGRVTVVKPGVGGGVRIEGSEGNARVSGWSIRDALDLRDTWFRISIAYDVSEQFVPKYRRLEGAPGDPTGSSYRVPKGWANSLGRAQDFQVGRMTWRRATDRAVWQFGPVLARYDAMGREKSALGMPTSDIWGNDSYDGASYVNGMIVWSDGTGAHSVKKKFRDTYKATGGVRGPVGLPIKESERRSTLPNGGWRQRFVSGTLYLNPASGDVYALWGAFDARYRRMGEAGGACGYPTSSVTDATAGKRVEFQNGSMHWSVADGLRVDCG